MKSWKLGIGLGVACAACCAVPLLSAPAALFVGSTSLAAIGSALMACANESGPLTWVLLALVAIGVGVGVALWQRKGRRRAYCVPGECR